MAENVRAAIVITGTELLTGTIADLNGPWLARQLGGMGFEVAEICCVGDRPADLEAALAHLASRELDLIVTSGGLGPTADDLTADVVARFAGLRLELDERMYQRISEILARINRGRGPEQSAAATQAANRKQAMLPVGSLALEPAGTAPGFVLERSGAGVIVVLPGPPSELRTMWPEATRSAPLARLSARVGERHTRKLRFFGLSEPEIAAALREIGDSGNPPTLTGLEIVTCLRRFELEVDISNPASAEPDARMLVDELARRYPRQLYSTDGHTVDELLPELLRGRSVATGESCTAGMLAARLTDPPGASEYVRGGLVAYSNEAKEELLDVPGSLIEHHGAVSPSVARAMAEGAIQRFGADLGCGITGIAGPGGGSEDKPVGYVCFCVLTRAGTVLARDPVLPGDRAAIRDRSVTVAMHLIRRVLDDPAG